MVLNPATLIENSKEIASLPSIFHQINDAVEDPDCSFSEVSRIISSDPGMSIRLLKLANSAFYGFSFKVETIPHAINVIGMTQLRDLVLATTVINQFKGIDPSRVNMKSFWLHSISCGLTCRMLATLKKEFNMERYFILGLLHDLGRLVLLINLPEEMNRTLDQIKMNERLLHQMEMETFGFDHMAVGEELVKAWKLPPHLGRSISIHHGSEKSPVFELEPSILHLSDFIVHALEIGNSGEFFVPPLESKAWDYLGLPLGVFSVISKQLDRQVNEAMNLFCSEN